MKARLLWTLPILAIALAWLDSRHYGLLADARFLIEDNAWLPDLWGNLIHDYFWSSSGNSIPYWRPLTKGSWSLESRLFGTWGGGFHLVQVAWHLLGVAGLMLLARRLGATGRWAALAGVLYGLHPALIEPTCLVMARSDVVAATATIWALASWHAWSTGERRRLWAAVHVASLLIALGSKEAGVIIAPLVTLWAVLLGHWRPQQRRVLLRVAPAWALALIYLLVRRQVLAHFDAPALGLDPHRVFVSAGTYLAGALPLRLDSGVHSLSAAEARAPLTLALSAAAWLTALALAVWAARTRWWAALILLAWAAAALAPVLLVADLNVPGVEGKLPLADRWMTQAVAAVAVLAALLASRIPRPAVSLGLQGVCVLWAVVMLATASDTHGYYETDMTLVELEERAYLDTPPEWRTPQDDCRALDRKVVRAVAAEDPHEVLAQTDTLLADCGPTTERRLNQLSALIRLRDFHRARDVGKRLLAEHTGDTRLLPAARFLYGRALLRTGDAAAARQALLEARAGGLPDCDLPLDLAGAAELLRSPADVATHLLEAYECLGSTKPDLLLLSAYWRLRAGDRDRAAATLDRVESHQPLQPADERKLNELRSMLGRR